MALIAGVTGMSFELGLFQNTLYFWVSLAVMVGIAVGTLAIAHVRHWI